MGFERTTFFVALVADSAMCSGIAAAVLRAAAAAALRPEETRVITFKDLLKVSASPPVIKFLQLPAVAPRIVCLSASGRRLDFITIAGRGGAGSGRKLRRDGGDAAHGGIGGYSSGVKCVEPPALIKDDFGSNQR